MDEFVPCDFDVPRRLETPLFVLEPLGPEHNAQDYDAWTSSMEHIHATPGWQDSKWPREMTPHENRADLQRHANDFRNRRGFTYTVLDPASRDVIGCVYLYPHRDSEHDARAHSWVRASHAHLDAPLWRAVSEWLASDWPFASVEYAARALTPLRRLRGALAQSRLLAPNRALSSGVTVAITRLGGIGETIVDAAGEYCGGPLPDDPELLSCSFCGKPEEMVQTLIRATAKLDDERRLCICDDCVSLCVEVLDENPKPKVTDSAF